MQIKPIAIKSVQCCELKKVRGTNAEISFQLEVENPNDFDITLKSYDLAVKLNGIRIGRVKTEIASVLRANSIESKSLSVGTTTKVLFNGSLLMGLGALLGIGSQKIEVQIVGSVVGKVKGFSKRIKVHETYPLDMHP